MDWPDEILLERPGERIMQRLPLQRPVALAFTLAWLALSLVLLRYAVVERTRWLNLSQANQFFELVSFPPRGTIFDRHGTPVAENIPSVDALVDYTLLDDGDRLTVRNFLAGHNLDFTLQYDRYLIIKNLGREELLQLRAALHQPEQVRIAESYRRTYPFGAAFGSVLGYIGFPTEPEVSSGTALVEEYIGKAGLEQFYQQSLRGVPGIVQFEKTVSGTIRRSVERSAVREGATVLTTLDAKFQARAYALMDNYLRSRGYRKATLIALDPRTGAIRALISYPSYDSGAFLNRSDEVRRILRDPNSPIFNRTVHGLYAPGSVIKPIVAAAALEEGTISPTKQIYSSGKLELPNPYHPDQPSIFRDWKAHGWTDMRKAIANSVNVYFYTIGGGFGDQPGLGVQRLGQYYGHFGLGRATKIDLPGERAGFIPTAEWKERELGTLWRVGDTYNFSIGQGDLTVTPIQIAVFTAGLATNRLMQPYLVERVMTSDGRTTITHRSTVVRDRLVAPTNLQVIQEGLRQTITDGTAKILNDLPIAVAGKSGTPEILGKRKLNAIFTGYAPYDNPELVLTILIEEVPLGAVATLPLYKEVVKAYFSQRYPNLFPAIMPVESSPAATSSSSGFQP